MFVIQQNGQAKSLGELFAEQARNGNHFRGEGESKRVDLQMTLNAGDLTSTGNSSDGSTRYYSNDGFQTGAGIPIGDMQTRAIGDGGLQTRATFSASGSALTSVHTLPGVPGMLDQTPISLWNSIARTTISTSTIKYLKEDTYTQAATAVAEGATKPEGSLDVSEVEDSVRKIAVWLKVTDEMLMDHETMKSFIDFRLSYMVESLAENHILNGTGATNQIMGLLNTSGIQAESATASVIPHDAFHKALTKIRTNANLEPTMFVIHPDDWENLKLTKDGNGQYYGGGPSGGSYGGHAVGGEHVLWGLPVVVTPNIAQGTALVGDFQRACELFIRSISIHTTNSDGDDFIKNLQTIRSEIRCTLARYKPLGFCTITGIQSA